jgi:hypothetical protein
VIQEAPKSGSAVLVDKLTTWVAARWRVRHPRTRDGSDPESRAGLYDHPVSESYLTAYGVVVVSFMMTMYALEHRGRQYVLLFAFGCLLSSSYGFLSGAWPFGVVEAIWSVIAFRRWRDQPVLRRST